MGLQFFHGYLLWGLTLFLLPILIHMLRRRRIQIVRLPTYEFLLRTQRRIARRSQLKNWLLLLLRISAVSLVVLLAARPLLSKQGWLVGSSWSPVHLVLVLDNSASMAYRTEHGSRFEIAKRAAARLIQGLSSRDRVSVWATADNDPRETQPILGKQTALSRLAAIRQSDAAGRPFRIIRKVMSDMTPNVDRRNVVILSDMARSDWHGIDLRSLRRLVPNTHIQFVRVAPEAGIRDVAVKNVRLRPWPPRTESPFAVVASVVNGDEKERQVEVSFSMDDNRVENANLDLKGGEEKEVSFRVLSPKGGILRGKIEITPDNLMATNVHYFSAVLGRRNRVLIIDGDPKRGLIDSEAFYVANALRAAAPGGDSPVQVEVVAGYEMSNVIWGKYDLVIACNVGNWQKDSASRLREFVERGGGLIWAGGSLAGKTVPGDGWLPAIPEIPIQIKPAQAPSVLADAWDHPVFKRMGSNPDRLFSRTRVRRASPLKIGGNGKALLTLQDGRIILATGRVGAGRVAVWGSTCDREWTDIPVRPAFLPFLRGLVDFLGAGGEGTVAGIQAGEVLEVREKAPREGEVVQFKSPEGMEQTLRLEVENVPSSPGESSQAKEGRGNVVARFGGTARAGFYEIRKPDGIEVVAANLPNSESNLETLGNAELRERFPGLDLSVREIRANDSEQASAIEGWMDLGVYLFLLLGLIFVIEGNVADRS